MEFPANHRLPEPRRTAEFVIYHDPSLGDQFPAAIMTSDGEIIPLVNSCSMSIDMPEIDLMDFDFKTYKQVSRPHVAVVFEILHIVNSFSEVIDCEAIEVKGELSP